MGSVWLARRNDGRFDGFVAIKLLHLALFSRTGVEHFRREGRVLGKLTHPNIARILDAGLVSNGRPYLVLEHVEGRPIDRFCDERALSTPDRIRLFLDVLAAVDHAHANLIVHRDIKPSNIHVTREGVVKLLDFGVAKLIDDEELPSLEDSTRHPREMSRTLTPQFAAPEQVLGEPISVATDVYALGVLLYLLLTGRHPTSRPGASALSHLHKLVDEQPVRASDAVTDSKLKRALRGDLDNILAKALKKIPSERYLTVREFADDLRRHLSHEPVRVHADSAWYRTRKFVTRHRISVASGVVAAVAIVGMAGVAISQAVAASVERDRALSFSSRAEAVANFLYALIADGTAAGNRVTISSMLARSETLARSEYRNKPEERAAILGMLSQYYVTTGDIPRAERMLRDAQSMVRGAGPFVDDLRRELTCAHAHTTASLGRAEEAISVLKAVAEDPGTRPRQQGACYEYLASVLLDKSDVAEAVKYSSLARERTSDLGHARLVDRAVTLGDLADAEYADGHTASAERLFRQSLDTYARAGRDRSPLAVATRNNWAVSTSAAGNPRRSLEVFDEAMRIVVENDAQAVMPSYLMANRARVLENLGRFADARAAYSECATQAAGASKPAVYVTCLRGLASISNEFGDQAAAEEYLGQAARLVATQVPAGAPEHAAISLTRAQMQLKAGRLEEARWHADAAIANSRTASQSIASLIARSEISLRERKLDAALDDANRALDIARKVQGELAFSNRTGLAWLQVGLVLAEQRREETAQAAFHLALENLSNTVDQRHPMLMLARERAR
jgi:serine/threonine-protein kinase